MMEWTLPALIIAAVLLVVYFLPFVAGPWLKAVMTLWGYFVGRRRRKVLVDVQYRRGPDQAVPSAPEEAEQRLADREFEYLERSNAEKLEVIAAKLEEIGKRREKVGAWYKKRREIAATMLPGRAFSNVVSKINRETGKDLLLFLGMMAMLFVDTLIAKQIFTSLGLYAGEKLDLWNKSVPYTVIYGIFLTITSAVLLHLVWPRERFRNFVRVNRWSFAIGVVVLAGFFVVRLLTVVTPDVSKTLMEVVMLTCWIIGIVGVYWLLGEIVGDDANWFKLVVAIGAPLLAVFFLIFGGLYLAQLVIEWFFGQACGAWYELRRARTVRQERNAQDVYQGTKRGFYRGLTL